MATEKALYKLTGHIEFSDIDFREFVFAFSEAQAKLLVRMRLQKMHPHMTIFPEWRTIEVVPRQKSAAVSRAK